MEPKKYLAFDPINGDYEDFDTIEEAQKWLTESFVDRDEGYHPEAEDCCIYQLIEKVKLTITDEKINYKYESEDDISEDDQKALDDEDFWPHPIEFDTVCKHEFIKVYFT